MKPILATMVEVNGQQIPYKIKFENDTTEIFILKKSKTNDRVLFITRDKSTGKMKMRGESDRNFIKEFVFLGKARMVELKEV